MLNVLLVAAACSNAVAAAVLSADPAAITPGPRMELVKRTATTLGWRSTGTSAGTTLWGQVTMNVPDDSFVYTSANLFRLCTSASTCSFFTCSGAYIKYASSSTYCGTSSGLTCSSDVLYTGISDTKPLTNYWCDNTASSGWTIYATTPGAKVVSTPASATGGSSATATSTARLTSSTSQSSAASSSTAPVPDPAPVSKSTPIGAIVGGVIGGLAVIAGLAIAAFFILKKKKQDHAAGPPAVGQATYYQPEQPQQPPLQGAYAPAPYQEKKPDVTTYAQYGTPATPMSPAPQYTPNNGAMNELSGQQAQPHMQAQPPVQAQQPMPMANELPAQRM